MPISVVFPIIYPHIAFQVVTTTFGGGLLLDITFTHSDLTVDLPHPHHITFCYSRTVYCCTTLLLHADPRLRHCLCIYDRLFTHGYSTGRTTPIVIAGPVTLPADSITC